MRDQAGSRRRRLPRGVAMLALLTVSGVPLVACGKQEERSLCSVFARVVESRAKVTALDPTQTTAGEAADIAKQHQLLVDQLQQVTDGRYSSAVTGLSDAMNNLRVTLDSVDPDADYATWAPLVEDSLKDVRDASANLEAVIEPDCPSAS